MQSSRLVRIGPNPLPGRSDDELMTLAQAGVREAFAVLVERHAQRLASLCGRFVNDAELGAEIAQDTWVAAWAERARYGARGKFYVWLVTLARNRCRNHLRDRGVTERHALTTDAPQTPTPDQIDRLLIEERRRGVREALGRIPERMREALLLRYAEELPYDEMVEVLGTGESTLRSRVHHGLRQLRNLLEKRS
jgi:RNA polymerase sigma-70 factor (ECF subfamily)